VAAIAAAAALVAGSGCDEGVGGGDWLLGTTVVCA